jgi:hypothetical protein
MEAPVTRIQAAVSKTIAFSVGGAMVASATVLLIAMILLGSDTARWAESAGRTIGVAATLAGVAGAAGGLWIARR